MGESVVVHLARRVDRLERKNRRLKKALLGMRRELTYLEKSRRRLNRGALAQLALLLLAMDALYRLDSLSLFDKVAGVLFVLVALTFHLRRT